MLSGGSMSIISKRLSKADKLYFIEGFYNDHYLINMGVTTKEVKVPINLLRVLRNSYSSELTIGDSLEYIMSKSIKEDKSKIIDETKVLLKQVILLQNKGVINLV